MLCVSSLGAAEDACQGQHSEDRVKARCLVRSILGRGTIRSYSGTDVDTLGPLADTINLDQAGAITTQEPVSILSSAQFPTMALRFGQMI